MQLLQQLAEDDFLKTALSIIHEKTKHRNKQTQWDVSAYSYAHSRHPSIRETNGNQTG